MRVPAVCVLVLKQVKQVKQLFYCRVAVRARASSMRVPAVCVLVLNKASKVCVCQ
jgi:hypothetical protein